MKLPNRMTAMITVTAATLTIGSVAVIAHGGATGVIKSRMEMMKDMGKGMKDVGLMVAGRKAYDANAVRAAAKMISAHAAKIPAQFPKNTALAPSEAIPAIWQNWDNFKAYAEALVVYGQALEAGASNSTKMGAVKITPQTMRDPKTLKLMPPKFIFAQIGKTCSGCHESFRKKQN